MAEILNETDFTVTFSLCFLRGEYFHVKLYKRKHLHEIRNLRKIETRYIRPIELGEMLLRLTSPSLRNEKGIYNGADYMIFLNTKKV